MGKIKKKFKKKINPQRSNKMIIAVAVGIVIVFAVLFLLTPGGNDTPVNKKEVMDSVLEYLEKGEGILALKKFPDQNKVLIVYDSYTERKDFIKIARYAGIKLSHKLGDEEITVILSKDKEGQDVYSCVSKGGRILRER